MHLLNRSGLAAIAATAFLTTPAMAQDVTPVTADPAPIVADTPVPSEPANPPAAETDTLAPAASTTKTARAARPVRATAPVRRSVTARTAVRTTTVAPTATVAAAAPVAPAEAPADPAMVAPLPEPVAAAPAPAAPVASASEDAMLPIAGAAGLGILALAGAAFAVRRRRRDEEEEVMVDEYREPARSQPLVEPAPVIAPTPVPAPADSTAPIVAHIAAPAAASAFAWGNKPRAPAPVAADSMSRIEAAKRGPTPDNPSASLKKRLARAAFFDKRDKMVAAGKAVPVDAMAGLPDAMDPVEPQSEPATETAPSRTFQTA